MLTFNNDKKFKKDFVAQIVKHRKLDQIVQGTYGEQNGQWHGCYLGCSLRSLDLMRGKEPQVSYSNPSLMESEGICPEWLARLGEGIFENLPSKDAPKFVEQLTKAIPVGVNLDKVKWQFTAVLMQESIDRVLLLNISESLKNKVVDAIRETLSVAENAITTGVWDVSAAESAASAALSAEVAAEAEWSAASAAKSAAEAESARSVKSAASAASAASSAASSAEWSTAYAEADSVWSAEWSASSAEWSTAYAEAESAKSAAYQKHAKTLIRLLTQAGKGNQ